MILHFSPFEGIEGAMLQQYPVRYSDLADIVHGGRVEHQVGIQDALLPRYQLGILAHPYDMVARFIIPVFRRAAQIPDNLQTVFLQLPGPYP